MTDRKGTVRFAGFQPGLHRAILVRPALASAIRRTFEAVLFLWQSRHSL